MFEPASSLTADGEVTGQNPPACNAAVLGMGTGQDYYNFDNPVDLGSTCGPYSFAVASQAQSWVNKAHSNFGFILAGPKIDFPDDLPQENDSKLTWYTNFQFSVLYDPAKNPRPQ